MKLAVGAGALGRYCEEKFGLKAFESKDLPKEPFEFVIAFGTLYMKQRKEEWERLIKEGHNPIGKGNLKQQALIETEYIGYNNVICNYALIEHNAQIGNHNYIAPGAIILSYAQVGDSCLIGANATILNNVKIGDNSIVGAGAVVTKDVEPNSVVIGVPAKFKRRNEW